MPERASGVLHRMERRVYFVALKTALALVRGLAAQTTSRAAISHRPPTQPRSVTVPLSSVNEPSAAPREKPRYRKDAFSDSAIGAALTPAMPIRRACWAGCTAHAATPQTNTPIQTGSRAADGSSQWPAADIAVRASAAISKLGAMTDWAPFLSLTWPPMNTPTAAAAPQVNRVAPISVAFIPADAASSGDK